MMGASSNMPSAETQLQHRHQLVHSDAAIAATGNMTLDEPTKMAHNTRNNKNQKEHAHRCAYMQIEVDCRQLMIWHEGGVHIESCD